MGELSLLSNRSFPSCSLQHLTHLVGSSPSLDCGRSVCFTATRLGSTTFLTSSLVPRLSNRWDPWFQGFSRHAPQNLLLFIVCLGSLLHVDGSLLWSLCCSPRDYFFLLFLYWGTLLWCLHSLAPCCFLRE